MRLFRRLKPLIGGAPAELPPPEVYSALIDDLHAPLFSFITGAATAVLVGAIASWRTENPWLVALTVCTAVVAAARILTIAEYRKQRSGLANDVALLRSFERRYAIGATIFAALLGLANFVAYVFTDDPVSFLLDYGEHSGLRGRRDGAQFEPPPDRHRSADRAAIADRGRHRAAPAARLCRIVSDRPVVSLLVHRDRAISGRQPPALVVDHAGKSRIGQIARRAKRALRHRTQQHGAGAMYVRCRAPAHASPTGVSQKYSAFRPPSSRQARRCAS